MPDNLQSIFNELKTQYGEYGDKLPPVEKWHPTNCGDIGLLIKKDGTWWQNGQKFSRHKLMQLFSKILRKDDDGNTYLVTPHEKVIIKVEDAHFTIIRADLIDDGVQKIILTTNVGENFIIDNNHKIWIEYNKDTNEPRPYVMVRNGLYALINRAIYYDLVNWGQFVGNDFGVFSNETFHILGQLGDED